MKENVIHALRCRILKAESIARRRHGNLHDGVPHDSGISP
jgi:hypothetical protein